MEEGVIDSPCTGDCRMVAVAGKQRCRSCHRDFNDLQQWLSMTKQQRLKRMEQLKYEQSNKK